ncbi:molybdopterin-dependent oxidoreductase [Alkalicella caledoniensis]|uniref:Molybdopterin-dependent oxidoreductase n=1 Tax=Alkalicella caledoniensis TaxID=2731377 RepID=A0A7G9W4H1_ALKCA|nr:molybdopterin-dependent oxidoreductase [Alkalicella caledoniensis]QNO13583.1 molybdopterin-dependent oxidoreductase [Alkalicella caledoniensis]
MGVVKSGCPLDCWDACSFKIQVDEAGDFTVLGDDKHPVTQGYICKKGQKFLKQRLHSPERLKTPLLKKGDVHVPISWDEALKIFADKIQAALDQHGPKSIAHYYDSGAGGLLKSLEHRFFNLLGGVTEPIGSLCWAAGIEAIKRDFGTYYTHHPLDMYNSDNIVIWGRNVTETNIHLLPFIKNAKKIGKTIIVIDPNRTKISQMADIFVEVKPGSDGFLAFAMIKTLLEKGVSQELLAKSNNFDDLKNLVNSYSFDSLASITGVDLTTITEITNKYLTGKSSIYLGYGMQRYYNSGNTIRAINSLAYLSGNIGVSGGGVNYADSFVSKNINKSHMFLEHLADTRFFPKPQFPHFIEKEKDIPIKLLYISRANPVVTLPNTQKTTDVFSSVDFVVCSDIVHTDTTKLADLILPATTSFEEEDLIYSSMWHRYINYVMPVVDPVGEARPEWRVFESLAALLGLDNYPKLEAKQWIELAIEPLKKFGIDTDKLKKQSLAPTDEKHIPWEDLNFATHNGKFNLLDEEILLFKNSKDYPYLFMTPHPKDSLHSQFQHHLDLKEYPMVYINPKLAQAEDLKTGDVIEISSSVNTITAEVNVVDWVHKKVLFSYEGRPLKYKNTQNLITDDGLTDIGNGTTMYETYCKLRKK